MNESLCKIELLGTSITIRTEEDIHYIKQLEQRVSDTIVQVKDELSLGDPLSIAIMAGVYLADENFRLKNKRSNISMDSENITDFMHDGMMLNKLAKVKFSVEDRFNELDKLLDDTLSKPV